jgi:hypothetical protein
MGPKSPADVCRRAACNRELGKTPRWLIGKVRAEASRNRRQVIVGIVPTKNGGYRFANPPYADQSGLRSLVVYPPYTHKGKQKYFHKK